MEEYSAKARSLLDLLTEQEVLQLRKNHPFKVDRNEKIREFHRRGVAQHVLAEICGMSHKAISKICKPEQPAGQA